MRSPGDAVRGALGGRLRRRFSWLGSAVVVLLLAVPAAASADTLGTTVQPAGSTGGTCFGAVIGQLTSDPSTPYMVPAGGGEITGWQTNTTGATPGAPLTFLVLQPLGGNTYSVVGADNETLPTPLPANNIASYTLATPIAVSGGETFGLYAPTGDNATCYWSGGSTPPADSLIALGASTVPNAGQTLGEITSGTPTSGGGFTLDLAATLVAAQDVGVTTSTLPTSASPGNFAVLASMVSNAGPDSAPITFIDNVPAGLQIDSVAAGTGSCVVAGQTVTCTIVGLSPGQSAPVEIVVTPSAAGNYANAVSVATRGLTDSNPVNNTASAVLAVAAPITTASAGTAKCVVPALKGIPAAFARRVLGLLGCTVGKVKTVHSHVAKGAVIAASPHAGTYAAGRVIALQVSSGPKRTHK
jgi:Domain of unknown function DUF11